MDENKNEVMPETEQAEQNSVSEENAVESDALESFLNRESEPVDKTTKGKLKKALWPIIAAGVVAVLIVVLVLVNTLPDAEDEGNTQATLAQVSVSVDEDGEHQAAVVVEEKSGKPAQNGSGTLVSYAVAQIKRIDVENESGSFTVLSETPVVENENGEQESQATVYTLVGYEDFALQPGQADAVANDASIVGFSSIADTQGNLSEFGLDNPRAKVNIQYDDGTSALVRVGNDAAGDLGVYIAFGESDTVYLAAAESVDSFLFSVLDLISLDVTPTAEEADTAMPLKVEISGTHYRDKIVIEENNDEALKSNYVVTAPVSMPADAVESADIAGAIRGIYAESVVCVNPSGSQMEGYGLDKPYAKLKATFTDMTISLSASAPSDTGSVYLYNPDKNAIYMIDVGAVEWANTSINKLTPETVIDITKTAVSGIEISGGASYEFVVESKTESVENEEGESEEITSTNAYYHDEKLDSDNFSIFFQNLNGMKLNTKKDDSYSGRGYTIRISYSTGRADDIIVLTPGSGNTMLATVNGNEMGCVYKSYVNKLMDGANELIQGKTVVNL